MALETLTPDHIQKNTALRRLYKCIPDRNAWWNKEQKPEPLCYFCNAVAELLTPLIRFYGAVARRLGKTALRSLCHFLSKPFIIERIESIVTLLFGTFSGDKDFFSHSDPILHYGLYLHKLFFSQLFEFFGDVIFLENKYFKNSPNKSEH